MIDGGEKIGRQAVVIGAGMAGLAAAGALANRFEQVVVLERDDLPDTPNQRSGTPQSWHAHGLLVGGLVALEGLFSISALASSGRGRCRYGSIRIFARSSRAARRRCNAISAGPVTRCRAR